MVCRIAEEAMTIGLTKDKRFGGLDSKLSISDQITTMIISGLTKPKCKNSGNSSSIDVDGRYFTHVSIDWLGLITAPLQNTSGRH
jgi:hypothetical protein